MRGDMLDVILLVACLLFMVSGYRQGFVVGVLSFFGFLGGGVLGAVLAPDVANAGPLSGLPRATLAIGLVFVLASLGQVLATLVGNLLRGKLVWQPARLVDSLGGAAVSVISLLLVAWLVGTAVASSPFTSLASQVRRSIVLEQVDKAVPDSAKGMFAAFRRTIDDGGFPEVFGNLVPTQVRPIEPPDPTLASSPAVASARSRVFKITGVARSCSRRIEGSGFLYAPERVMTNAHVVAGVERPEVEVDGEDLKATVVVYDPDRDLAVLYVPGLRGKPLDFTGPAKTGQGAIVVGFPQDGPFRADSARIRGTQSARGPDIYQRKTVVREIYSLRARVRPGNSGGALIDTRGDVLGVIFAAAADDPQTGYALTAKEASADARKGRTATKPVSTQRCD